MCLTFSRTVINNPRDLHNLERLQDQFRERASELQVILLTTEPPKPSRQPSTKELEDKLVRTIIATKGFDEARCV